MTNQARTTTTPALVIAGAGIAGLALAIRCRQHGIPVRLLEARAEPTADGAGIQLGPNAVKALTALGVREALGDSVCVPDELTVRLADSGRVVQRLPLGRDMAERFGAPYWVVHRADLHQALRTTASNNFALTPEYGKRVVDIDEGSPGLVVRLDDGEEISSRALVAADGIWSKLRRLVGVRINDLGYSGKRAARTVVDREKMPGELQANAVGLWFSPHGHVVHYPVHGGRSVAIIVVTMQDGPEAGWGKTAAAAEILADLEHIAPALDRTWVSGAPWRTWALFDPAPFGRLVSGSVALIGDAAHPILPFLAQGGAMALEDAVVLGDLLAHHRTDRAGITAAFFDFDRIRRPRAERVQAAARRNGEIYHMSGAMAVARNTTLSVLPGSVVMSRYDWLYGWVPPAEISSAKTPAATEPKP